MTTENKAAHTSGPWFAVAANDGGLYISNSNALLGGRIIAEMNDGGSHASEEEDIANTALIVTAPLMLSALEAVLSVWMSLGLPDSQLRQDVIQTVRKARSYPDRRGQS